ncbi:MAG: pyridoxal phosphate-dependent aminotransferase [Lachnospiraceae bacterium]|nr:pyridoxal phosphate-dependent aminotransferase [Lachnospiraceae bacterium]
MRYDFNKITDRTGTNSLKWDKYKDALPMWVADMDIEVLPEIREVVVKRAEHGIYGYTTVDSEWSGSYINWWKTRHSFEIRKEWLRFVTGVIPAMNLLIRNISGEGDNVVIQTPVYPAFFNIIRRNKRNVLENMLIYDRQERAYSVDWTDLEAKLSDPETKIMILCNPQNPAGNIWDKETLKRIGELCEKNGVTVLSDEIHCDIVAPGREYTPFASVSEINRSISISFISPTKAFNVAGIQSAAALAVDPELRKAAWECFETGYIDEGNYFSTDICKAAFSEAGAEWIDQLRIHLWNNRKIAEDYIRDNMPELRVIPSDASYLMWVDCSAVMKDSVSFVYHLERKAGVMFSAGKSFGGNGDYFVRINLACPESMLKEGLTRFRAGVASYGVQ